MTRQDLLDFADHDARQVWMMRMRGAQKLGTHTLNKWARDTLRGWAQDAARQALRYW